MSTPIFIGLLIDYLLASIFATRSILRHRYNGLRRTLLSTYGGSNPAHKHDSGATDGGGAGGDGGGA